ncbi:MAG: hypothetical protein EPGJADBJ_04488 [Saprospiraceae bacterium]|nr:hypothetical protein [Saprospiraceae bacterium]
MNNIDFSQPNGFPLEADVTLGFMQSTYQNGLNGIGKYFGEGVILSGLVEGGGSASDGWIMLDGELLFFEGGTIGSTFIIDEIVVTKANNGGTLVDRYFTRKAKFGTGGTTYNYADLQRLEGIQALQNRILDAILHEPEVVLSGCAVSSVNTGLSTLAISEGVVVINRKFINVPAYSGGYPVYIDETGEWQNSPPSGDYIIFNPYTSQRHADVIARATSPVGDVKMRVALSDRFDNTGLGKWEMLGWAICNGSNGTIDMRSRFPVAYDNRNSDPGGNIWDTNYQTPGNTGGEKVHTLIVDEIPAHRHTNASIAEGELGMIRKSVSGQSTTVTGIDSNGSGSEPNVIDDPEPMPTAGGGLAHENRPPWKVMVFIQRI